MWTAGSQMKAEARLTVKQTEGYYDEKNIPRIAEQKKDTTREEGRTINMRGEYQRRKKRV